MKNAITTLVAGVCSFASVSNAETVFSGLDFSYHYAGFGDLSLEENQDRITDNVWIVRGTMRGVFNIAQEPFYQGSGSFGPSPLGTLWAYGTTADYDTLSYTTWADLHDGHPPGLLDTNVVVHLLDDDIYIDLMFTQWEGNGNGGEFAYVRSNIPSPGSTSLLLVGGLIASRRRR
ncbi:MAG: hypothetical protein P1U42_00535 [Phycisphaerales bacterium]|nr:hypothetical protein [Phycisphaerales bacterium]